MADVVQKIIPIRVELDSAEEYRTAFNTQFCLNLRADLNLNARTDTGNVLKQGSNVRKQTPVQSTEILCDDITLPEGNNIATGAFESKLTQEIYWLVWNSLGNHSIWVYGVGTQTCRKVYQGGCLNFHFEPQHHVPNHRAAMYLVYDSDENGIRVIRNKYFEFTDGINWQFMIDVESAIATDSYNAVTFPYFTTFYPYCDPCEAIQLGIRPPQDCPVVLPFDDDTQLQFYETEPENNNLKQKVWFFSYSYIDIWGRHSVMSPYSTPVFLDGGDCNADSEDIKCFRLQLNAGSWMVEKIIVYFSNDGINWFKYDEIDKWEDCVSPPVENFWDRELALQNYYAPTETCNYDLVITVSGVASFTVTFTINGETVVSPSATWSTFLDYMDSLGWTIVSAVNSGGAGSPKIITLTFPGSPDVYGNEAIYTISGVDTPFEIAQSGCVPSDCPATGCFSTFTYSWDLLQSPQLDIQSASIVINGETKTNSSVAGFHGLIMWLNSLGLGTFTASDTDQISTSSANNVYGTISINSSPPDEFEPEISEISQCSTANTFIYQFCGNKQCIPIAPTEVARLFDDLPIASVAQCVVDDKLALGNNLKGYDNFICPIENVQITMVQDESPCEPELVTITIDAVIQNINRNQNNPIYQYLDSTDIAFGGFGEAGTFPDKVKYENEVISSYKQQLINGKGFIGGLRGTNFKTISQQYFTNDLTTPVLPKGVGQNSAGKSMIANINTDFYIQRFVFKVPKGNYIFEIYSHLATGFNDAAGTSTYVYGVVPKTSYRAIEPFTISKSIKEVIVEACDGDFTYDNFVVIADLTKPKNDISLESDNKAISGYLREKDTNVPIELALVEINKSIDINTPVTDHNGFYFAADSTDYILTISVIDPQTCTLVEAHEGISVSEKQLVQIDTTIDPTWTPNLSYFSDCAHEIITGAITDCNGHPIQGVSVVLSRTGQFGVTDLDGVYTILAHDNAFRFSIDGVTRKVENIDFIGIPQQGVCIFDNCDAGCDTCIDNTHVDWTNSCFHCDEFSPPETPEDHYDFSINVLSGALTGMKTGGSYKVAIIGYDYLDRNNSAQLLGYFTIPTIQSNGVFAPYHLNWAFLGLMNFPSWVKKIRFAISANSNDFLLEWAANKVEFIDSLGNITAPGIAVNIRIYLDSLNDFRAQAFFNTNVGYSWVAGDRIRFITKNSSGDVFGTTENNGLIDLPVSRFENGNSIIVPFDARLIGLESGATFELYRQPVCEIEPVYWEQCPSIPVLFNEATQTYEPTITSGTIPFYDTYWYFRNIPLTDKNGITSLFTSQHRYEHYAPSDFWGTTFTADIPEIRLFSRGRPFVRNENARQTWHPDEISWSESLLQDGIINGLGTWRVENKKDYGVGFFGGIVGMKAHNHLLYAQCENDFFYVNISLNLLQVTSQGNVIANPDYFGASNQKIGNNYGVDLRDTSTLIFYDEWVTFVDTNRGAVCTGNYQSVEDISKIEAKSYFIEKLRKVASLRDNDQYTDGFMFIHQGFDPKTGEIIFTAFARVDGNVSYGNGSLDIDIDLNETISFNYYGQFWSGQYSFTPERFICFESGLYGTQLISFVQGKPHIHHKVNPEVISYNNFYGTQYKKVFKAVFNGGEGKNETQKIYLAVRIECKDEKFTCDNATTQTGQLSKIPPEAFEKIQNYFEAPVFMDENSAVFLGVSPLIDGTNLFGTWIKMRFVGEEGKENEYCEILGIIVSAIDGY